MRFDARFSDPAAEPTPWPAVVEVLERAELYWISTVRRDGRPHVTPLVGVWHDGALHFTTGPQEQKHRNLDGNAKVAVTTGNNAWKDGLDVVVEGEAVRVTEHDALVALRDAYLAKYGEDWRFEVGDGAFGTGADAADVFRVEAAKVLAFAKRPHGQTAY